MKVVVLGASAGVGRAIAEALAGSGSELVLVARDDRDLEAVAKDLSLRFGTIVHVCVADLARPDVASLAAFIADTLGAIEALFVIAGFTDPDDRGLLTDAALEKVVQTNFLGPLRAVNALLPLCGPQSHLVFAGSVAAIRPRGSNVVYGAAKNGLEFYAMAVRHACGDRLGSVACYRLGYIATAMTFGQKLPLPAIDAGAVAKIMIARLGCGGVHYLPGWWRAVGLILHLLPWTVFKRLRL